ncbi:MAG: hypothetical protein E7237_06490 [Sarcina sp.]|nr:hypothetical protein [Sarcina sp.]
MRFLRKRNTGRAAVSVFAALVLTCVVTACGFKETGSAGSAGTENGTGTGSGSVNAGERTGTGNGTAAIAQDSVLNFDNDAGFARLQADMASGDIPVECNVLYDVMGERPDVTVKDPEMIREIYERLSQVKVGEKSMTGVTDSYHHVSFHLRNDTFVSFYFEGESLFCWGKDNYYAEGGGPLWSYVRQLQETAMDRDRQKAAAKAGTDSAAGTAAASAAGRSGSEKKNSSGSSGDSSGTVLDGKNPTADTGKNNGKDTGASSLTGQASLGNAQDREITAQHAAGELTQQASGVEGSGRETSKEKNIPGNGQHADALQGTIPATARDTAQNAGQNVPQNAGQSDAQNVTENAGQSDAQNVTENAGQSGAQDVAEGTQPEVQQQSEEPQPEMQQSGGTQPEEVRQPGEMQPEVPQPEETQQEAPQPGELQPEVPQPGETQPGSGQEDPLQAQRTAAMNSAYTEIVRAYAAVLAVDRSKFLQDYENGAYSTGLTAGQSGSGSGDLSGSSAGNEAPAGTDADPAAGTTASQEETAGAAGQDPAANTAAAVAVDPRINYEMFREYFTNPDGSDVFYGLRDYNGDGTPELVIALGTAQFRHIWAGYTFDGQKAVPLFTGRYSLGYRVDLYTLSDGSFMIHGSGGATAGRDTIARIAAGGTGLEIVAEYEYDEQANGTMDHLSAAGTLSDEEFRERYWNDAKAASEDVAFNAVRADAVVQ